MSNRPAGLLRRNLDCIDRRTALAVSGVAAIPSKREFRRTVSRTGLTVTGEVVDGHQRYFHSTYDPKIEADRLLADVNGGLVIVLGLGTGHHLAPLLDRADRVIVVEPDLELIAASLDVVDLSPQLSHPALQLIFGHDAEHVREALLNSYHPALDGSARAIELPGEVRAHPEAFADVREAVKEALGAIADDFAVQARFGNAWMRNTVANLAVLTGTGRSDGQGAVARLHYPSLADRPVVVAAAGPSLNFAVERLVERGPVFLLATDTALPSLIAAGATPDAVFTVDCQITSYLHYLTSGFPDVPVLADLAAPPGIFQSGMRIGPLLSLHPLHGLLTILGLALPAYDSSGGNVTHAAVAYAVSHGAASVTVVGADLSYPRSESYARDSYVHRHFSNLASRTLPVSGRMYGFAQRRPGAYRDPLDPTTLRIPQMDRYRESLQSLAAAAVTPVTVAAAGDYSILPHTARVGGGPVRAGTDDGRTGVTSPGIDSLVPADILARLAGHYQGEDRDIARRLLAVRAASRSGTPEAATASSAGTVAKGDSVDRAEYAKLLALLPLVAWYRRALPDTRCEELLAHAVGRLREVIRCHVRGHGAEVT